MSVDTLRWIFATLCALGLATIICVAAWEMGRARRGVSGISPFHLRWRLISAVLWLLILGSLFTATVFYWPNQPLITLAEKQQARRFLAITSGAVLLLFIAGFLMIFDFKMTLDTQRKQKRKFQQNLDEMPRREIKRHSRKKDKTQ